MAVARYYECPDCKKLIPVIQKRCDCGRESSGKEEKWKVCPAWLLSLLLTVFPLVMCQFPWWVNLLIFTAIMLLPDVLGGIMTLAVWVWSFIVVVSGSIGLFEVIYFVLLAVYVVYFLIPGIRALIAAIREKR